MNETERQEQITVFVAFRAMFRFLEAYNQRGGDDALAVVLSDLQLFWDGMPGDPAAWSDWLDAVDSASREGTES